MAITNQQPSLFMRLVLFGHETTRDVLAKGQLTALAAVAKKHWPVAAFNTGQKYVDPSWSSHVTAKGCGCHGVGAGNPTDQLVGSILGLAVSSLQFFSSRNK